MNPLSKYSIMSIVVISFIAYVAVNDNDKLDIPKSISIGLIATVLLSCLGDTNIFEKFAEKVNTPPLKVEEKKPEEKKPEEKKAEKKIEKKVEKRVEKKVEKKAEKVQETKVPKEKAKPIEIPESKAVTKQKRSKLSMQEQKIVDKVQERALKREIRKSKEGSSKNPEYGYSFLNPSMWNVVQADDRRSCIAQNECPVCPQSSPGTGTFLQIKGAIQEPPTPTKSNVA